MEYKSASEYYKKELPEFIYHYTSLETLALILKSEKIRLNRLDQVNDLQEARTTALGDLSKSVFVSCWNATDEEKIYMWKLYGDDFKGIRLKLRSDFFMFYILKKNEEKEDILAYSFVENVNQGDNLFYADLQFPLYKIDYVSDVRDKDKLVFQNDGEVAFFNTNLVGTYKHEIWKHEEEWRIKLIVFPQNVTSYDPVKKNPVLRLVNGEYPEMKYFDIDFCYTRIDFIEITIGPCMSDGDRILLDSLIKNFSRKTKIYLKESDLKGKLR